MANDDGAGGNDGGEYALPEDTMAILRNFLDEQKQPNNDGKVEEDWQLSQFWYSEDTCKKLVNEAVSALGSSGGSVACVSCPSLMDSFLRRDELSSGQINHLALLEFDDRFHAKFPDHFVHYDYNSPLDVSDELRGAFDVLLVDPPFISEECMVKMAQTVRLLSRDDARIIFCTGSNMEELLYRLLKLRKAAFRPEHERNLGNEFAAFINYNPLTPPFLR